MKRIIYYFVILHLLFSLKSLGQDIDWSQSRNWKLYDIHNKAGFNYSVDTLSSFKTIKLSDDTMHAFLRDAVLWPTEKYSMWMGLYVASCELPGGKISKILISTYGGFFYIDATKRYLQIPANLTKNWFEWLNTNSKMINQ